MILSEKKYNKIFNLFLCILPVSFVFMKLANILVILFVLFNLIFYKKLVFNRTKLFLCTIVAIPLLLDLLFFLNNSSFYLAIKSTEKHLLFLIFPIIIIGYNRSINFNKLLKTYVVLMLTLMVFLFIRYIIIYPEFINKYIQGIHLWEMGYHFTNSFNNHAPALNMHLSFMSVMCFYLIITAKNEGKLKMVIYLLQFLLSIFFLFYVNTRVAVVSAVLGCALVSVFYFLKSKNKTVVIKRAIILGVFVSISIISFVNIFPYSIKKYTEGSFANMDMVGRLDEFENPKAEVFNALVTRVSIWKSALELSRQSPYIGFGAADAKQRLFEFYKESNQKFLYKYKFPVHNQFIDYLIKYGIIGVLLILVFMFFIGYIGLVNREPLIFVFFVLFFLSNLTDDFLILFSGISFSAFWVSIFSNMHYYRHFYKLPLNL